MFLNNNCKNNVSDEDCCKCMKLGIIFRCPTGCEYFEDELKREPEEKQLT